MRIASYRVFTHLPDQDQSGNSVLLAVHEMNAHASKQSTDQTFSEIRQELLQLMSKSSEFKAAGIIALSSSTPTHSTQIDAQANFFNPTHNIQLCGHGLYAASVHLKSLYPMLERLNWDNGISANWGKDHLPKEQCQLSLPLKKIESSHDLAYDLSSVFTGLYPKQCLAYFMTQASDGYILIHISDDVDIARLIVDFEKLKQLSTRACCIFNYTESQTSDTSTKINMRYFAPQFGTNEDTATGSVLTALAPALKQSKPSSSYEITQHSALGGRFNVSFDKTHVHINAYYKNVTFEPHTEHIEQSPERTT